MHALYLLSPFICLLGRENTRPCSGKETWLIELKDYRSYATIIWFAVVTGNIISTAKFVDDNKIKVHILCARC